MMRNFITSKICSTCLGCEGSLSSIRTVSVGFGLLLLALITRLGFEGLLGGVRLCEAGPRVHRYGC